MRDCPDVVAGLCETFGGNIDQYRGRGYNEARTRIEFINPFWSALGWDMDNKAGYAVQYRDVVHEDAIREGAPDYCFRIGGARKFFLEAKRPGVDIDSDPAPAYQLRRYAWTCDMPLSVLTDFEETAIYDCRIKPKQSDKASTARILFYRYDEYVEKWPEIASVFSREAVLKGSFDTFVADKAGKKRGTARVDVEFLKEIEGWRETLAKDIAKRNPSLDVREMNFAVQKTIDRIVFLRMCEDRGIEPSSRLRALCGGPRIYPRLLEMFRRADEKYNSGLFHFRKEKGRTESPDTLTPTLDISDAVLEKILSRLYYPECPYEFGVLPVEILGNVYEQFLGKVVRLTKTHRAKVEEKPEVRKAGGVYYTPPYVVDHIVEQTVGKLCEGKTPKEASSLRVLDPACGSGSFLLGAYRYLLDWHLEQYLAEMDETGRVPQSPAPKGKRKKKSDPQAIFESAKGWILTTSEKKRILLNNIYGVDIDAQAVEVTKLSLLLRVLEDENEETLASQLKLFQERALPDLAENIRCGNSLIGPDFYAREGQQTLFDDEEERLRINVFDWGDPKYGFGDVMNAGGFDAVIGNPPWGQKEIDKDEPTKAYLREEFPSCVGIFDQFRVFVELAVSKTKDGGYWGFVLPDIILLKQYPTTRKFLLDELALEHLVHWGMAFESVVIDAVTISGRKERNPDARAASRIVTKIIHDEENETIRERSQEEFLQADEYKFNLHATEADTSLLARLREFPCFADFAEPHEGVHSGNVRQKLFLKRKQNKSCRPLVFGRKEVQRYHLEWHGKYVNLSGRVPDKNAGEYANLGRPEWYEKPKLVIRRTGDHLVCCVDGDGYYFSNNVFVAPLLPGVREDILYLLGLLNSKLMTWYYLTIQPRKGRVFSEVKIKHIKTFPVRPVDFSDEKETALHDRMVGMVGAIIDCNKRLQEATAPHVRDRLARDVAGLDRQIDTLVYELYGLTDDEIELVESSG